MKNKNVLQSYNFIATIPIFLVLIFSFFGCNKDAITTNKNIPFKKPHAPIEFLIRDMDKRNDELNNYLYHHAKALTEVVKDVMLLNIIVEEAR